MYCPCPLLCVRAYECSVRVIRCYRCFAYAPMHVFVSTRNMVLTFAHINTFKSAQYVILNTAITFSLGLRSLLRHAMILMPHSRSFSLSRSMCVLYICAMCVHVPILTDKQDQFQVFGFRCCALRSVACCCMLQHFFTHTHTHTISRSSSVSPSLSLYRSRPLA